MKKLLLLMLALAGSLAARSQAVIPYQEIPYDVTYHWGLINVNRARGVVTVQSDGNRFYGTLDGTSIPWEGKIICVSDTLSANMGTSGGRWVETVDYQSGWYRHPSVSSFRSATYNPDEPSIYKNIAGQGTYDASNDSMEAITVTSDMLGMYYYAHLINFEGMKPGDWFEIPIQGPFAKEVRITYNGQGIYTVNGDTYRTYDCTFEYSYGGSMSGYPVKCKVGVDNRILMQLSASLPVGEVEMLYTPN